MVLPQNLEADRRPRHDWVFEYLTPYNLGKGLAEVLPSMDMRYKGQWFEINVPLDPSSLESVDLEEIVAEFHRLHDIQFGYHSDGSPIDVLNVRLAAIGRVGGSVGNTEEAPEGADPISGSREIWSPEQRKMVDATIYNGELMRRGDEVSGPAIIELGTTSIVVLDEYDVVVDVSGSFVLYLRSRAEEMRAKITV